MTLKEGGKHIEKIHKACLIGCGKIAGNPEREKTEFSETHIHAASKHNIKVNTIIDIDKNKLTQFSNLYNVDNAFTSLSELDSIDTDLFIICSPDETHYQIINTLISSHSPRLIFCEKPVCQSLEELNALIAMSKESNTPIMVNYNRRFLSNIEYLYELINSNALGDLEFGNGAYYSGLIHNGSHLLDLINFLFNQRVTISNFEKGKFSPYLNDDSYDFRLDFVDSVNGSIDIKSYDERYYQLFELYLYFQKAKVSFSNFCNSFTIEYPELNIINEHVLSDIRNFNPEISSFDSAYNKINLYLSDTHKNQSIISPYLIQKKVDLYEILNFLK